MTSEYDFFCNFVVNYQRENNEIFLGWTFHTPISKVSLKSNSHTQNIMLLQKSQTPNIDTDLPIKKSKDYPHETRTYNSHKRFHQQIFGEQAL